MTSINRCINLNNNETDPTDTFEHLCPPQYGKMYPEVLAGMAAAILDYNESSTNAPHSGQK